MPRTFKINLMNCLSDPCYKICSSYKNISNDVEQIKTMIAKNGNLEYFQDECVHEVFNRKFATKLLLFKKKDSEHLTPKKISFVLMVLGACRCRFEMSCFFFLVNTQEDKASVYIIDTLSKIETVFTWRTDNLY